MKLSFDDRLAELSESFNEANFADAMNGVIFMDLGGELLKVRKEIDMVIICLLYTSPSPRDKRQSRMPSSA